MRSSSPRTVRPAPWTGRLARGSLLLAVVAAVVAFAAPAAWAGTPSGTAAVQSLGSGRQITLHLHPAGLVPWGLDLSGASFRLTGGGTTATCRTDEDGDCTVRYGAHDGDVDGTTVDLHAATYTVKQTAGVAGLTEKSGVLGSIKVCDCWDTILWVIRVPHQDDVSILNASEYRGQVVATVVDADTNKPVRSAQYRLTGPGYPVTHGLPAVPSVDAGSDTTDVDGRLVFTSPVLNPRTFRPGSWTLTPVHVPAKYAGVPVTVTLNAGDAGGAGWTMQTVRLSAATSVTPPSGTGSSTTPSTTTADPTTVDPTTADPTTADPTTADPTTADPTTADPTTVDPTTVDPTTTAPTTTEPAPTSLASAETSPESPAASSATSQAPATGTTSASPSGTASAAPVEPAAAGAAQVAAPGQVQQPAAETTTPAQASDEGAETDPSSAPTSTSGGLAIADPQLQTESSTLSDAGLVGIGVLFVAVVAGSVVLVRTRARRR